MENNTDKKQLPEGWEWKTIPQLTNSTESVFSDGDWVESKDQDPDGGVRLIQLADIADGYFKDKSARYLTIEKANDLNCTFLKRDDILVARMPDPLGRACIFPFDEEEKYVTVVDVAIVRGGEEDSFSPKYLMHAINSPAIRHDIDILKKGTTRKRISRKNLGTIKIPTPSPSIQKQIVEKIEALFSELDHAEAAMARNLRRLQRYRQSLLRQAFSGALTADWRRANAPAPVSQLLQQIAEVRQARHQQAIRDWQQAVTQWEDDGKPGRKPTKPNAPKTLPPLSLEERAALPHIPEGWEWVKASDVIDEIDNGYTPKANFLSPGEGQIPFLKVYNLKFDGTLNFKKDPYFIPDDIHKEKLKRSITKPGDVLINIVGPPLGKVSIVTDQYKEWNINQAIVRYRPNAFISSKWLSYYMQDLHTVTFLENTSKATAGQYNVKVSTCREVPVPLIDIQEQTQIVNELEEHLSVVEQLEQATRTAQLKAKNLRRSILQQAFEGKLI